MGNNAAAWRTITDAERAGWVSLGQQMTRADSLGQVYDLTGFQAYCSVNNNKLQAGDATVSAAPALITPGSLATVALTLTAASMSFAYTVTPLATGVRLFIFASPQKSAGVTFNGDYRFLLATAAAAASPQVSLTQYTAKFGVPVVGNKVFFSLQLYQGGFLGAPFNVGQVVA